jgi:hypothetical protein
MSSAFKATEAAMAEDLGGIPDKKLWVKKDSMDEFWSQFDAGLLSPEVFMRNFHMSQATFDFIYNELAEHLRKSNTTMREPLPAKKRLAATLYRLATNAEYLKVASLFGIGKSTTTSLVRDVCDVIVSILKDKYLTLSDLSGERKEEVEIKFEIPQVVGALGSIDVFIVGSTWDWSENSPFSSIYSQSYALIFQAVVDHKGHFKHVSACNPAGMSNLDALKRSNLSEEVSRHLSGHKKTVDEVDVPALLVADESYAGKDQNEKSFSWILTPFKDEEEELEDGQKKLNEKIGKANALFEESVFKIKSRWKIFHGKNGKINFNADAFDNIAMACCILHNICEAREDPIDPNWSTDVHDSLFLRKGEPSSSSPTADGQSGEDESMEIVNGGPSSHVETEASKAGDDPELCNSVRISLAKLI